MEAERRRRLHGRRKGKPLSARRTGLMADAYPALAVDLSAPPPEPLSALFAAPVRDVRLEIGFGGGEHLVAEAQAHPESGFIGVEPFVEGLAKGVSAVSDRGLGNVRLHDDDAAALLDWLPPASLSGVDLFYPDPWPKRRHWKRRFVGPDNIARIARALAPGGLFRVASDIDDYIDWTLRHMLAHDDFAWTAEEADDWRTPYPGWPGTRYEAKALREGRRPTYLAFRRA